MQRTGLKWQTGLKKKEKMLEDSIWFEDLKL